MAKKGLKGIFITFEGCEGSGKSTHSKLLFDLLKKKSVPVIHLREPGGTAVSEKIRKVLLDPRNKGMTEPCELFLFEAARAQLVKEKIIPSLKEGKVILCDRFCDATIAYQGYAGGIDIAAIKKAEELSCAGIKPDLTLLLDIPTKKGLTRSARKWQIDRMEQKAVAYHKKVRQGYLALARATPGRIKVIKVREDLDKTQTLVREAVMKVLIRKGTLKP